MNATYLATARLLTEIAPPVFESGLFALKAGTAINLFIRDMPRLSVDLDPDHRVPRADALAAINEALRTSRERLAKRGLKAQTVSAADVGETKLLVQRDDLSVKIEVNTVLRGAVYPTQFVALTPAASDTLMAALELPLLSMEDIYGSKLVAALDRQHPDVAYRRGEGRIHALSTNTSLLWSLPRIGQATPFIGAGVGLAQHGVPVLASGGVPIGTESRVALTLNAGGGLKMPVNEQIALRTDARWFKSVGDQGSEQFRVAQGVSFNLGGR